MPPTNPPDTPMIQAWVPRLIGTTDQHPQARQIGPACTDYRDAQDLITGLLADQDIPADRVVWAPGHGCYTLVTRHGGPLLLTDPDTGHACTAAVAVTEVPAATAQAPGCGSPRGCVRARAAETALAYATAFRVPCEAYDPAVHDHPFADIQRRDHLHGSVYVVKVGKQIVAIDGTRHPDYSTATDPFPWTMEQIHARHGLYVAVLADAFTLARNTLQAVTQ